MPEDVPVALFIFNRPDLTKLTIAQLSKSKPPLLYVFADGPRNKDEEVLCNSAIEIVKSLSWECEVHIKEESSNKGMVHQIKNGLDYVFSKHEAVLFMQDDQLLSPSSYNFVKELITKYKDDERIGHINLSNFNPSFTKKYSSSYFFSSHIKVWGFATWRRMWRSYSIEMPEWSQIDQNGLLRKYCSRRNERLGIKKMFDLHCNNNAPWTWDYQWVFNCWNRNTLAITPTRNLCIDIGFERDDSSHNTGKNPFNNPIETIDFPLIHPENTQRDKRFDKCLSKIITPSALEKIMGKLNRRLKLEL
jgi:hypothetical protein